MVYKPGGRLRRPASTSVSTGCFLFSRTLVSEVLVETLANQRSGSQTPSSLTHQATQSEPLCITIKAMQQLLIPHNGTSGFLWLQTAYLLPFHQTNNM